MPRWLPNLLGLILVIGIPPFLILMNVFGILTPNWIAFQYSRPDFPPAFTFDAKSRLFNASESLEYVAGNRTHEQFKALGVYDEREIKHMVDVRVVIANVRVFWVADLLLLVAALVILGRAKATRALAASGLRDGAILTIALFIGLGAFAAVGFNQFFILFHKVFFEGDTWLFNVTDSLIQFYPLPFWIATTMTLVGVTVVEAVVIGAMGWWWGKKMSQ
ncbi:MAG: TIGR01906 family membrane protein [Chloroflexi bacterium]|nr:TIGR01906 family membrane protein [Chloroflexota bacterium]